MSYLLRAVVKKAGRNIIYKYWENNDQSYELTLDDSVHISYLYASIIPFGEDVQIKIFTW